ncbi:Lrp/AsnC family transcriptional regulator [Hyphomonas sp.]|jgi:Lrp/AsnC family transcriptional regulator, leucine-responsive regulatory protein|uniref:Lrp/AsnC family transcriptional regulator n=1 Tax=Hyphomonas sp. TaxID=87 RepID=UPI003D2B2FDD
MLKSLKLDATDLKILRVLQQDGSISNLELADKVALSATPCSRRVKLLEEAGFFRGRVTLVSQEAVGLPMTIFIQITLSRQKREKLHQFEAIVGAWPEIMEMYLMTGDFDYLLRVVTPSLQAFNQFLVKLTDVEHISHIKSSFALNQIRYKTELPLDHLAIE